MAAPPRRADAVVARLRPHPRALFWPSALLVVLVGATVWSMRLLSDGWRWLAVGVAVVIAIVGFAVPLVRWASRRTIITDRRVVVRRGFPVHTREELLHASGYRATLRRNPLQVIFGSGDLVLEAGGEQRILVRDVPNALLVQEALGELVEQARRVPPSPFPE